MIEVSSHDLHEEVGVSCLRITLQNLWRSLDKPMKLRVSLVSV